MQMQLCCCKQWTFGCWHVPNNLLGNIKIATIKMDPICFYVLCSCFLHVATSTFQFPLHSHFFILELASILQHPHQYLPQETTNTTTAIMPLQIKMLMLCEGCNVPSHNCGQILIHVSIWTCQLFSMLFTKANISITMQQCSCNVNKTPFPCW